MGLFGDIDVSEIAEDPFYVAPGTYLCVLSEATVVTTKNDKHGLALKWSIDEPDSEYNNLSISDWFTIYPDITPEEVTPQVRRDQSNMKKRLVSDLGVDVDALATLDENLDDLIGIAAYVSTKETPDKNDPDKKWVNITKVQRVDEE